MASSAFCRSRRSAWSGFSSEPAVASTSAIGTSSVAAISGRASPYEPPVVALEHVLVALRARLLHPLEHVATELLGRERRPGPGDGHLVRGRAGREPSCGRPAPVAPLAEA